MTTPTGLFRTILCAQGISELQSLYATAILVSAKQGSPTLPKVRIRTGGGAGVSTLRDHLLQVQTSGSGCRAAIDHRR